MSRCTGGTKTASKVTELSANADVSGLEVAKLTLVQDCATYNFADKSGITVSRFLEHDHIALYNTNNTR